MAPISYALCAIASLACFVLLFRSYFKNKIRLLLWSSFCFLFLTIQNLVLFADLVLIPNTSFLLYRTLFGLIGSACLLFGLIWERR